MTVYLVRHGETAWSASRRHTGRTDVGLTERGRQQAVAVGGLLAGVLDGGHPDRVLTSPLSRAADTCTLAGLGAQAEVDERLLEWDYGHAEGRTTAELRTEVPGWSVWTHPLEGGETLAEVAARCDDLVAELRDPATTVVAFAHAHLLRILGARWCGLAPEAGRHLILDPAGVGILAYERETPCLERWNVISATPEHVRPLPPPPA